MSDLLKSAIGYFNAGASPTNGSDNDFVGQIVEVGSVKLRVKRVIAEGWCIFLCSCFFLLLSFLLSSDHKCLLNGVVVAAVAKCIPFCSLPIGWLNDENGIEQIKQRKFVHIVRAAQNKIM